MRFSKVLLVSPPSSSYLGAARPPQNLGYLAQALLDSNIEYDVLDMRLGYKFKHLVKKIESFGPQLIGISLVSLLYKKSYELIRNIKNLYPNMKTVVGGPHVTVLQEKVLEECPSIDYGIVYEGEETLVELCKDEKSETEIKGLIHKKDHQIIYNGNRPLKRNLDQISFPRYEKFELKKYINEMPLYSSRGCPYECIFCLNKLISKHFRWRSPEHVVDEIEYWYKRGYRIFNFDDDNFSFINRRVYGICDEIERRGIKDAEFRCSNGLRADRVTRELLARMRKTGFNYIAFGVDGGNNKMLKMNKKGETIEQIEKAIKNSCELGFDVKVFCVIGMPHETREDIEDSFRVVQKYPIKRVIMNNPIPYPGTELFEIVKENHWFLQEPEVYLNSVTANENIPVFETPQLSKEDRIQILKEARRIEKRITRKGIEKIYKKYFLLGKMLGFLFATDWVEKLFFHNKPFRKTVEHFRYKRMLKKRLVELTE